MYFKELVLSISYFMQQIYKKMCNRNLQHYYYFCYTFIYMLSSSMAVMSSGLRSR